MIDNKPEHRKILNRIITVLYAFLIHKAVITVIVVISKGYLVHGNLFTLKSFEEILFFNFSKWDSNWYINIAMNGYYSTKSTAFFPLYPLLIRLISKGTSVDYIFSGVAISSVCFLIALYFLQKLVEIDFCSKAAEKVVYIFALNPIAFYFTSVYTESLFLMLSIVCLYSIRNKKWLTAGIVGGLCSGTRNTGVILTIPFAIEYLYTILPLQIFQNGHSIKQRLESIRNELKISNINKF
ncbi:MAG: mannosyltransferase family protein, partial [Ruminiclostridium sp.]